MVFYVLGGLGPTIAPFAVIGFFDGGEMKAYLSRIFKWRINLIVVLTVGSDRGHNECGIDVHGYRNKHPTLPMVYAVPDVSYNDTRGWS